jgi:hypothetical protein
MGCREPVRLLHLHNVCFWHKAEIAIVLNNVRFWVQKRTLHRPSSKTKINGCRLVTPRAAHWCPSSRRADPGATGDERAHPIPAVGATAALWSYRLQAQERFQIRYRL